MRDHLEPQPHASEFSASKNDFSDAKNGTVFSDFKSLFLHFGGKVVGFPSRNSKEDIFFFSQCLQCVDVHG